MSTPIPLFGRKFRVVVSTIEITKLDVQFQIHKDLKAAPNKADLKIWNLNEAHRSALEQMQDVPVSIEAGYKDGTSVIFLGDLRSSVSKIDGPDIVTELSSGDGEKATRKARINVSIKKATPTDVVIKQVAKALGVGDGNLNKAISQIKAAGFGTLFSAGTVLSGSAVREMSAICKSVGMTWSVQNGSLQVLPLAKALDGEAYKLNSASGMIGSPSVDSKGVMHVRMLMAPEIFPGRKLVLDAKRLKGQYRIEACDYSGDTFGGDWFIDIEGKRY